MAAQRNPYKKPDRFTVAAKKAGFPARSVFKLEEIDRRVRIFRPGMRVLDLGAAPGSWSLFVAQRVGPRGHVLAIDLTPITVAMPANVEVRQGDAFEMNETGPFDVVLSDMAPSTTGVRFADQARSFDLFMQALAVAERALATRGTFVGKIFMGEDLPKARAKVRELFTKERLIRPEGTRSSSYELFVIGENRVAQRSDSRNSAGGVGGDAPDRGGRR
ncbi:MAG TPA: RlmE family RNA methyltransferase [Polyangiaceae bacterium]|jgi:23S rRNA (uridine2552-2'-O)-methyltransferase